MPFVLDASVAMNWAFPDEKDAAALAALRRLRTEPAHVPSVWWFEVRNVLLINERRQRITERRQRITEADTMAFLRFLSGLDIEIDHSPDDLGIGTLCRRHRLSVYDTSYLELAVREDIPLVTLDKRLAAAAKSEGVSLIG
jgi:predicted nucleic acid-binding protein